MASIDPDRITIDLQVACDATGLPPADDILLCVQLAAGEAGYPSGGEVSVRFVDEPEMRALNQHYRDRDGATNVLAFPAELSDLPGLPADSVGLIGDIVVCTPVVTREAAEQGKQPAAHCCHLLIHGMLHLLGYDHESEAEAVRMEALEVRALARHGIDNPYKIKQLN